MGKIKKILENELVGGTQTTDVYPVTSVKAVYDENNERLDHILNRRSVVNISTNYNDDHIAEVLTRSQAIAKVPSEDRVLGFQGNILTADGWVTYKFVGTNIAQWSDTQYWIPILDSSNIVQEIGNNGAMKIISQEGVTSIISVIYPIHNADSNMELSNPTEYDWISNKCLNSKGKEVELEGVSITDYIGDDRSLSLARGMYVQLGSITQRFTSTYINVAYYDINKKFLGGFIVTQPEKMIYVPARHYVRISVHSVDATWKVKSSVFVKIKDNINNLPTLYANVNSLEIYKSDLQRLLGIHNADSNMELYNGSGNDAITEYNWLDKAILADGTEQDSSNTKATDYIGEINKTGYKERGINVWMGDNVTGAYAFNVNYINVAYYDKDKKFLFGFNVQTAEKILYVPVNYYIRICVYASVASNWKVKSARKAIFRTGIDKISQLPQLLKLQDVFSSDNADSNFELSGNIEEYDWIADKGLNKLGQEVDINNVSVTDYINEGSKSEYVKRGRYILVGDTTNSESFNKNYLNVAYYDENKNFIVGGRFNQEKRIFYLPIGYSIRICVWSSSASNWKVKSGKKAILNHVKKQIYCFGDSITQSVSATGANNRYPNLLGTLLGSNFEVNNCGVSGATMANVLGRMGGIPIFLNKDFVFGSGVTSVTTTSSNDFRSAYPSVEEARTPNIVNPDGYAFISPCLIDGYMCDIAISGRNPTTMTISLQDKDTDTVTLHKGSILMTYGGKCCQDNIVIIMAGINGTYTDAEDYVKQLEIAAKTISGGKYLILSQFDVHWADDNTYQTYKTAQLAGLDRLKALENLCLERFGNKFVNMREQLVNNGLKYAIEGGYLAEDALSESNNIDAISNGIVPFGADKTSSSTSDYHKGLLYNVHPNNAGNYAMAMIVYKALKQLYIE